MVLAFLAPPAVAAPGNDDFADAQNVNDLPATISFSNAAATLQDGENHSCGSYTYDKTVWYRIDATAVTWISLRRVSGVSDVEFAIFKDSMNGPLDSGSVCGDAYTQTVPGHTYYIQVGAFSGGGSGSFLIDAQYQISWTTGGTGTGAVGATWVGNGTQFTCEDPPCWVNGKSTVTVSAQPAQGSTFTKWSGACTGTNAKCTFSMTGPKSFTAWFGQTKSAAPPPVGTSPSPTGSTAKGSSQPAPSAVATSGGHANASGSAGAGPFATPSTGTTPTLVAEARTERVARKGGGGSSPIVIWLVVSVVLSASVLGVTARKKLKARS